jgi:hypothetical protein
MVRGSARRSSVHSGVAMAAKDMRKRAGIAGSVDEYLARLDPPERTALKLFVPPVDAAS